MIKSLTLIFLFFFIFRAQNQSKILEIPVILILLSTIMPMSIRLSDSPGKNMARLWLFRNLREVPRQLPVVVLLEVPQVVPLLYHKMAPWSGDLCPPVPWGLQSVLML